MNQFGGTQTQSNHSQIILPDHWRTLPTLSTQQVALICQVKEDTVRTWACKDTAPFKARPKKVGRKLLWPTEAIAKAIS